MNGEFEIRVVGVDAGHIREHSALQSTWVIPFRLSSKPDESWVRNFNDVFKKNTNVDKKKAHVVGDHIEVNVTQLDNQQQVLDLLKKDIADTNAIYRDMCQQKMKIQDDLKALQKANSDTLLKMKSDAENLKF